MALPVFDAVFDAGLNGYVARNTGTWANLTTWESWTNWTNLPANVCSISSTVVDRGTDGYFNLRTEIEATGNITYTVYTSTTGNFAGEESITTITSGTANLAAFNGRYYAVQANVASTGELPRVESFTVTDTSRTLTLLVGNVETVTLSNTSLGPRIPINRVCSAVTNVQITCHDPPQANLTLDTGTYYLETPISNHVVPYITSHDRMGPTFVLRNINIGTLSNHVPGYRIDASVTVLPEQIHDGRNLVTR